MKKRIFVVLLISLAIFTLIIFLKYSGVYTSQKIIVDKIKYEDNLDAVYECDYMQEKAYSFVHGCCDMIDSVYDSLGNEICRSGGIMGMNTCTDKNITNCQVFYKK